MKTKPVEQEFEDVVIELKNKMVILKILPFDTDILVDEILKIDYTAIFAEIITWNVLFNRIANLQAELQDIVNRSKFDLEILNAQLIEEYRKKLTSYTDKDSKGNTKTSKPTKDEVDNAALLDPRYKVKKNLHFDKMKNLDYISSLYWSAQNKAGLLKVLSDKMKPEEFSGDILTDSINGVMIKQAKKII